MPAPPPAPPPLPKGVTPVGGVPAPAAPATVTTPKKVAYLVNLYPSISHTFIRREIAALERAGFAVSRFSIRSSPHGLVTPADKDEDRKTDTLIRPGARLDLLREALATVFRRPGRFLSALGLTLKVGYKSTRGFLVNLFYLAEACVLAGRLQRAGVHHVHVHFGTNSATVAMMCHALGGPTYSFTIHGPEEFDDAYRLHLRPKIEHAAFVVAVSSFGRSQVYRHCGALHWSKVHVVRCGVDDDFLEGPRTTMPSGPRLVSVGRLCEQKGQLLLIEALGELHRRGREFHMTLVGDGEMRADVERAVRRHDLEDKVTLAGWGDEATVRKSILEARALVLPSFAEGLPVVLMEAMALARPVVSTYVAGIPELVEPGKNGWLVPAGSVEHLVTAIEEVLAASPQKLATMGEAGRARVLAMHHTKHTAAELAGLLQRWV